MNKRIVMYFVLMLIAVMLSGCTEKKEENVIIVSAAASLKEPLEEIAKGFESNNDIKVNYNFAGSGILQKQIEEGAPVDLFISAGKSQMDTLQEKKLIDTSTRKDLFENDLVLVYSKSLGKIETLKELLNKNMSLAIGEVKTVPAGEYARQSFEALGIWENVSKNVIYAKSVKDVLQYVLKGEVQAGVTYKSDAAGIDGEFNILLIDSNLHEPILYPAAVVSDSSKKEEAKIFMKYITSENNKVVFDKYKFKVMK